jgi:hypothetical protein
VALPPVIGSVSLVSIARRYKGGEGGRKSTHMKRRWKP